MEGTSNRVGAEKPVAPEGLLCGADSDVQPTLSVVMPTLNEEEGVRTCIGRIKAAVAELGVTAEIVVSDSSSDRTPEIARELGAIVVTPDEPGYGYAYRYAFERVRGEYVVMGDADTTYDFESIPRLLEPVWAGEADIVMGSRLEGEIRDGAMPSLHQYVGNPLLTKFLNTFYDAGVSDAHSGFRVFTRDALEALDLETTGMEFASEMVMDAAAKDLVIEEVPITYHEREGEETLDSFSDGWRHVKFMLTNAPGYLFSIPGAVMVAFGVLWMGLALDRAEIGPLSFGIRTMIAGSLVTLVGYQVGSLGVFSTLASDPIRRPEDPVTTWVTKNVNLEHAATFGVLVAAAGFVYASGLVFTWVSSGYSSLPSLHADILAFTAIVLGIQTVFGAFFLSTIADDR